MKKILLVVIVVVALMGCRDINDSLEKIGARISETQYGNVKITMDTGDDSWLIVEENGSNIVRDSSFRSYYGIRNIKGIDYLYYVYDGRSYKGEERYYASFNGFNIIINDDGTGLSAKGMSRLAKSIVIEFDDIKEAKAIKKRYERALRNKNHTNGGYKRKKTTVYKRITLKKVREEKLPTISSVDKESDPKGPKKLQ